MTPQNKVNIGAYMSRREVHRILRPFEQVVLKPVHPMRHINEVQVARAVTLIQEGWTFGRVAVALSCAARLLFFRSHINWQLHQCRPVVFTDGSRFSLTQRDGRQRVWRRRGEQYMPNVVQEDGRFGQGSVMVWGGVSTDDHSDFVDVSGNLTAAK